MEDEKAEGGDVRGAGAGRGAEEGAEERFCPLETGALVPSNLRPPPSRRSSMNPRNPGVGGAGKLLRLTRPRAHPVRPLLALPDSAE